MTGRALVGMTLCSGIGAPEAAAPWIDWRFACEIAPFPRDVLIERFGYRPPEAHQQGAPLLWSDMAEVTPALLRRHDVPLPDIIVAGTPCQAFSLAGLRGGLADARGNLTLAFVDICHAIAAARPDGRLAVLWENVPGVLSDRGNAFGHFLGGLVGAVDPLPPPSDGSWPGEGMVEGPRARAAWAVLDAQWFGVAQRRRRVFVVVDFGDRLDPAAVLLECDRLRGDSPPRREAREGSSGRIDARAASGDGQAANSGDISYCLTASAQQSLDAETETLVAVAHGLRGEGFDASEDGTGRGTPIVPVAFDCMGTEVQVAVDGSHPPLRSMGHSNSHQSAGGHAAIALDLNQITSATNRSRSDPSVHHTLPATTMPPHLATAWAVRRLTPRECHRLQGFADDHCAIVRRGKPAADGPQYKALGNSMAVPVIAYILNRMRLSMEAGA